MFDLFDAILESDGSTSSPEASLAKTYPWLENVLALLEAAADCGSSSRESWLIFCRRAFLWKQKSR